MAALLLMSEFIMEFDRLSLLYAIPADALISAFTIDPVRDNLEYTIPASEATAEFLRFKSTLVLVGSTLGSRSIVLPVKVCCPETSETSTPFIAKLLLAFTVKVISALLAALRHEMFSLLDSLITPAAAGKTAEVEKYLAKIPQLAPVPKLSGPAVSVKEDVFFWRVPVEIAVK
jgi:hypothetical protein